MLTVWGRPNSHNVKKVMWLVDELDLPPVRHDVGGASGMDAAYLAKNPNALIPTVEEDGLTLWESNACLRYIAARHGGEAWWPADPAVRAIGDKWADWQFAFADANRDAFKGLVRTPPEQRDTAAIAESAARAGALMGILDDALAATPWLSGDRIGVGDIPMGTYAHTWFTLPIDRPDRPHVRAWYHRLLERPAYARHVAVPLT